MRIGIDARSLGGNGGGDETYVRNVIAALSAVDLAGDYTVFLSPDSTQEGMGDSGRLEYVAVPPKALQVRIPLTLPLAMVRRGIDVFHGQYLVPPICPVPSVVSVHDIAFEHFPQFFPPRDVPQYRILVPLSIRRAKVVLTLSEFCKRDIERRYCVPPEKVIVAGCAADPAYRPLHDKALTQRVVETYSNGAHFILCVGNLQPRKNLKTLITAYVKLRKAGAIQHRLVVVGRKAWLYDDTFAVARGSGYEHDLVFTSYVPQDDLVALYNAADLFVYPSIFEGFGLPPIEAMACGTPVITSNTSCFPEILGDAAVMVDPLNSDELAHAIAAVLRDPALRTLFSRAGLERAAKYSWDATARIIRQAYDTAIAA